MENASKALLIAGSILIVILLIAFGMRIFNSTKGTGEQVEGTMQTTEMAMFNNKFIPYLGDNRSKSDALSLLNIIQAHNATNTRKIDIVAVEDGESVETVTGAINTISNLDTSVRFIILPFDHDKNGYYDEIDIAW